MPSRPFRFSVPVQDCLDIDSDIFWRFIESDPNAIRNPWPELAPTGDRSDIARAWSQPLINAIYLPMAMTTALAESGRDLPMLKSAFLVHEEVHTAILGVTPAKEVARIFLADAYDSILDLQLLDETAVEEVSAAWERLLLANTRLGEICELTVFSEELMATLFTAFLAPLSESAEADWVASQAFQFQRDNPGERVGFVQQYASLRRFNDLIRDLNNHSLALTAMFRLAAVLQPLPIRDNSDLRAMDAHARYSIVTDALGNMDTGFELLEWLGGVTSTYEAQADWCGMLLQKIYPPRKYASLRLLSAFAHGEIPDAHSETQENRWRAEIARMCTVPQRYLDMSSFARPAYKYFLFPTEYNGTWYIKPIHVEQHPEAYRKDMLLPSESIRSILAIEGFRQSINSQRPILCDGLHASTAGETCVCHSAGSREAVYRLSERVNSRLFGETSPHTSPCPPGYVPY